MPSCENRDVSIIKHFHSFHAVLWSLDYTQKMTFQCIKVKFQNDKKILVSNIFYHFLFAVSLGNWALNMSEKFRLDHRFCFQNTFYTKCINVIIDSIGPSIILRSIFDGAIIVNWT